MKAINEPIKCLQTLSFVGFQDLILSKTVSENSNAYVFVESNMPAHIDFVLEKTTSPKQTLKVCAIW